MGDELGERAALLEHVPDDRLRGQVGVAHPRMRLAVDRERLLQRLGERPGVGDLLQQLHALLVLDALELHLRDRLAALLVGLRHEDGEGVVEDRLDHRDDVERVLLGLRVQQLQRDEREGRQRLVEREVLLQLDGQPQRAPVRVGLGEQLEDPGVQELGAQRLGLLDEASAPALVLVVVLHERAHGRNRVAGLVDDVEDHRVVHAHP